ncbi:SNF1-interacting protein [Coemansia spiralis]|nr:SNF1-interacting protein [Coemansia spiralis]
MGNAPGKLGAAMVFDGGSLAPNGIYAEDAQDFDAKVVQRLIVGRRLAPFYEGADEPAAADGDGGTGKCGPGDDGWWSYNLVVAQQQQEQQELEQTAVDGSGEGEAGARAHWGHARKGSGLLQRLRAPHGAEAADGGGVRHERSLSDMSVGANARQADPRRRYIECPICFLYYPRNINYTRCCHKPICTECFVQIKRKLEDNAIVPTRCPYCVEANLGIVYHAPVTPITRHHPALPARAPPAAPRAQSSSPRLLAVTASRGRSQSACPAAPATAIDPPVVMSDDIRPALMRTLAARLDARRKRQLRSAENMALVAAATRRASALENSRLARAPGSSPHGTRRPSLSRDTREYARYLVAMQAASHSDLEEFMFQEAVRASLADQPPDQSQPQSSADPGVGSSAAGSSAAGSSTDVAVDVDAGLSRDLAASARIDDLPPPMPPRPAPPVVQVDHPQSDSTCAGLAAAAATDDQPPMSPRGDALTLAEYEFDAIANVGSGGRRRRRPAPPAPRPVPSHPVSPPEPDDLMRFDEQPAVEDLPSTSASPPLPVRPRRRPPPPPPAGADREQSSSTADKSIDGAPASGTSSSSQAQALFL